MKAKILVFHDGIAVEPPKEGVRWCVRRNKRGIMWSLRDNGTCWTLERHSPFGGKYTSPLMMKSNYEVENINDEVDNWKYYR